MLVFFCRHLLEELERQLIARIERYVSTYVDFTCPCVVPRKLRAVLWCSAVKVQCKECMWQLN